jgi:hypothetical protein
MVISHQAIGQKLSMFEAVSVLAELAMASALRRAENLHIIGGMNSSGW